MPSRVALSDTSCCVAHGIDIVIACLQRLEQQNVACVHPSLPWTRTYRIAWLAGQTVRLRLNGRKWHRALPRLIHPGLGHATSLRASVTKVWHSRSLGTVNT